MEFVLQRSFKLIDGVIWLFAHNLPVETLKLRVDLVIVFKVRVNILVSRLDFEVSFSVKVFGLDIAHALGQSSVEKEDIARHWLVLRHFDDVSWLDFLPLVVFELPRRWVKNLSFSAIFDAVILDTLVVFEGVFHHRHQDHKRETQCVCWGSVGD